MRMTPRYPRSPRATRARLATLAALAVATLTGSLLVATPASAATVVSPGLIEETSSAVVYTGSWKSLTSASSSGGKARYARHSASASLSFRATSVTWYTWKSKSAGISNIYIDGKFVKAVDNYAATTAYRVAHTISGLSSGTHVIKIATSGKANAKATDKLIHLDSFVVGSYKDRISLPAAPTTSFRYTDCPAATASVSSSTGLDAALSNARPGTVIRLAPGTYTKKGGFAVSVAATAESPVWICGPRTAIVTAPSNAPALRVNSSQNLHISGFTIANSLQGVMVKGSRAVTVTDLEVRDTGYEAIHLYAFTTDSSVMYNKIVRPGRAAPRYGEGVYIGTSPERWGEVTAGKPDASNRNVVAYNDITDAGAEPIEAKGGTADGLIHGNTIRGYLSGSTQVAWIMLAGDGWLVRANRGYEALTTGIAIQSSQGTWGKGNVVVGNSGSVIPGYGVHVTAAPSYGTFVSCDNVFTSTGKGNTNVVCTP